MKELKGKHAFVTAGTAGIGLAIVQELLKNGVNVSFFGRDEARLEAATRSLEQIISDTSEDAGKYMVKAIDLGNLSEVESFYSKAESAFGPVQILVNNHGGPAAGKLLDVSEEAFLSAFELIVHAAFKLSRLAVPGMKKAGWGRVINVLSLSAKESMPNMTLSNIYRPAAIGLAKSMAIELAGDGITVNSILPAAALTDRTMFFVNQRVEKENKNAEEIIKEIEKTLPVGRLAMPEEFGKLAAYLCSDAAGYITGNVISMDGGLSKTIF
ncbi:MAG: SDR family oxidoreductase [Bacteroidetes bacterium]|nr:SDR family oxidoreductase [Bacteroidota bacterium]